MGSLLKETDLQVGVASQVGPSLRLLLPEVLGAPCIPGRGPSPRPSEVTHSGLKGVSCGEWGKVSEPCHPRPPAPACPSLAQFPFRDWNGAVGHSRRVPTFTVVTPSKWSSREHLNVLEGDPSRQLGGAAGAAGPPLLVVGTTQSLLVKESAGTSSIVLPGSS